MSGVILSYPRSGNTFFRYCLEWMSGRPTVGADGHKYKVYPYSIANVSSKLEHVNISSAPIAIKRHQIEQEDYNRDWLIIIVRNYKEAILRHKGHHMGFPDDAQKNKYYHPLEVFEKWTKPKMLIRYHDLISKNGLTKISKNVFNFLNLEDSKISYLNDLINNQYTHRQEAIKQYPDGSKTKGQFSVFHSRDMSIKDCLRWDESMKKYNPKLYCKYLEGYKARDYSI